MNTLPIPSSALSQHVVCLGKTGSLPAYKRDPRRILCIRRCQNCNDEFPVARKYPTQRFCSRKCGLMVMNPADHNAKVARATIAQRSATQRGRGEGRSYRKLMGRHEHRVVAEQKIGRPLKRGEIVHHIDGNRLNNHPDNLQVMTQSEHTRIHMTGVRHSAEHVRKVVESRKRNMTERQRGNI